jgi:hypothetical protein
VVHDLGRGILELGPPQVGLVWVEDRVLEGFAGDVRFAFGERLDIVEAADEQQVGELFDDFEGVGDAAGPEGVPDAVDLAFELTDTAGLRANTSTTPATETSSRSSDIATSEERDEVLVAGRLVRWVSRRG